MLNMMSYKEKLLVYKEDMKSTMRNEGLWLQRD
jgi:hypothetical protein